MLKVLDTFQYEGDCFSSHKLFFFALVGHHILPFLIQNRLCSVVDGVITAIIHLRSGYSIMLSEIKFNDRAFVCTRMCAYVCSIIL